MTFERPRDFVGEHKVATAAVTAAAAAATAAAVAGYTNYRNKKLSYERELDESHAGDYEKHLSIFEQHKLPEDTRRAMATVAVHIFYANEAGHAFITGESLREHFEKVHGEEITRHELGDLTGHLKQHKLIGRAHGTAEESRSHGYAALAALQWGMLYSENPHPLLREAGEEMIAELTDN